jgi:hypothetical protein
MAWDLQLYPINTQVEKAKFDIWCRMWAKIMGARSGNSVKRQLGWAISKPRAHRANRAQLECQAVAFNVGFIDDSYLSGKAARKKGGSNHIWEARHYKTRG